MLTEGLRIAGLYFGQVEDPRRKGNRCHEIRWCKGESKRRKEKEEQSHNSFMSLNHITNFLPLFFYP